MSKLYIFGIGGTGARVIKALSMLLASGVEIKANIVIPILLDPHQNNEDLKRAINILENYQKIRNTIDPEEGFFKTKIQTLKNIAAENPTETTSKLEDTFSFKLEGVSDKIFQDYIGFKEFDAASSEEEDTDTDAGNRALCRMLFSEKNLKTQMDIGFVGNPNIGSVVLNQFKDSTEFKCFASNFDKDDRVFIISSIFGGTGSSGFPIILKNIREADKNPSITNKDFLVNAKVGAITVLPYFGVENTEKGLISKSTFVSKTKAALSYYSENITGNKSVNALYYIGDEMTHDYTNDPGENGQKNDAHFVELAAALSIIDFMRIEDELLQNNKGVVVSPIYKDFAIGSDTDKLSLRDLCVPTQNIIIKPLSQYYLMKLYCEAALRKAISGQPWCNRKSPEIDGSFLTGSFYNEFISEFNNSFTMWLIEMARNVRGFEPYSLIVEKNNLFSFINKMDPKKPFFEFKKNFDLFNDYLNQKEQGKSFKSSENKFMSLMYEATSELLTTKYDQFKEN